jgi:hypothetical protein
MSNRNRFTRTRAGSTYTCECCGKRTRETGHDESSVSLCAACYFEAQIQIMLADYSDAFTRAQEQAFTARLNAAKPCTPDADTKALAALYAEMEAIAHPGSDDGYADYPTMESEDGPEWATDAHARWLDRQ